jgi:hypothetical protein
MSTLYFENTKNGKRYKVIKVDKEKGEITLQGQFNEFIEKYDKERFTRLGYKLIQVEDEAA